MSQRKKAKLRLMVEQAFDNQFDPLKWPGIDPRDPETRRYVNLLIKRKELDEMARCIQKGN